MQTNLLVTFLSFFPSSLPLSLSPSLSPSPSPSPSLSLSLSLSVQVKDITESVFNGVPKRHHINCGFTVIELLPGGEEVVYHLLAEVIECLM